MHRCAVFCSFSALLLIGGIYAGQRVHTVLATNDDRRGMRSEEHDRAHPGSQLLPDDTWDRPTPTDRVSGIFENSSGMNSIAATLVSEPNDVDSPPEARADDSKAHRDVVALIREVFPDADPEAARIWADAYSEMDLADVAFILDQRRLLSRSLTTGPSVGSDFGFPVAESRRGPSDSASLKDAIRSVSRNLGGSWSVGFRRTVLLPEIATALSGDDTEPLSEFQTLSFYSFESGQHISSPVPLHVALPQDDGALMFRLERQLLTRRGDFRILPDRRVGLRIQTATVALLNSPILPIEAQHVLISEAGEIQFINSADMAVIAGKLDVARVPNLSLLTSADGVMFTLNASESLQTVEPDKIQLAVRTLELSNVERKHEEALLGHLQSSLRNTEFQ